MRTNLQTDGASREVPNCDSVRPRMAKMDLPVTESHTTLLAVIEAAILNAPEKKEALAHQMGKDRAQMYRQAKSGHLTVADLASLGPDFAVRFAQDVLEACGPHMTLQARIRYIRREQRRLSAELDLLIDKLG